MVLVTQLLIHKNLIMMKKISKIKGHISRKYGEVLTVEQKTINLLVDKVVQLEQDVISLKNHKVDKPSIDGDD